MNKKQKIKSLCFDLLFMILLIIFDQVTKYYAVIKLKNQQAFNIINGFLEFNYLENRGAAFGMLQNQKIFFVFIAVIFLVVIAYVLYKVPNDRKYYKLHILAIMISAGAIGNLIDRLRFDYVVDFIYFVIINFPIFNVADMYVTIASFVLIFLVLFVYKDNDFNFLSIHPKKFREYDDLKEKK